jgi:glycosyltransferase involved in cell wall biosynthesis
MLAALYRRAAAVLLPSDREGFGLPLVEALKSGAPVVASDIGVLREVGADAAVYFSAGNADALAQSIEALLRERMDVERSRARRAKGIARAQQFSWGTFAAHLAAIYHELHAAGAPAAARGSAACPA